MINTDFYFICLLQEINKIPKKIKDNIDLCDLTINCIDYIAEKLIIHKFIHDNDIYQIYLDWLDISDTSNLDITIKTQDIFKNWINKTIDKYIQSSFNNENYEITQNLTKFKNLIN